jgi:hypothetical protein
VLRLGQTRPRRITYANAENPAPFPCAAVYLGKNVSKFADLFNDEQIGGVWVRLDRISDFDGPQISKQNEARDDGTIE